jgi:uncharacterized protein (UPF0147 family)
VDCQHLTSSKQHLGYLGDIFVLQANPKTPLLSLVLRLDDRVCDWVLPMPQEAKLRQVADMMARMADDNSVPRNIRRAAGEAKNALLNKDNDAMVRASSAVSILDEISNDPNMPVHTRTMIWNAISVLETIKV